MSTGAPAWVQDAVFYQIVPDRFARSEPAAPIGWDVEAFEPWDEPPSPKAYKGGDLWAAARRLDHLTQLGVTALYLTPIFTSTTYHRYKPIDFYSIDPLLGGEAAFDRFLAETRGRGLRVVLDGVFNHVGIGFRPFLDVLEYGPASPWRDWFHVQGWPLNPFDAARPANYRGWHGHRSMPELNHRNPGVRDYILRVAEHWLRRGIDGWRFDAPQDIDAEGFWQEMRDRLRRIQPEAYLIGEIWTDATRWLDGTQWDGVTNYPLSEAWRQFAAARPLRDEHLHPDTRGREVLDAKGFAARVEELLGRHPWHVQIAQFNFVNTHDVARYLTVAGGDRTAMELATLMLFTFPGVPCVYYADETGLEGGPDPDCRRGFPAQESWDQDCLQMHRRLIALRKSRPELRRGRLRMLAAEGRMCVYARSLRGRTIVVAVNSGLSGSAAGFTLDQAAGPVPDVRIYGSGTIEWGSGAFARAGTVRLPPRSGAVFGSPALGANS